MVVAYYVFVELELGLFVGWFVARLVVLCLCVVELHGGEYV